jgi:hypothetical protein
MHVMSTHKIRQDTKVSKSSRLSNKNIQAYYAQGVVQTNNNLQGNSMKLKLVWHEF